MRSHSWDGPQRRPVARKRIRAFFSIVQVLAVVAAAFFVLPLVYADEQDPVLVEPGGEATLNCEFTGQAAFPGDTIYCQRRIGTNTHLDVSLFMFTNEETIKVLRADDSEVPKGSDDYNTFLSFWSLSLRTQPLITRSLPEEFDVDYDPRFVETCAKRLLTSYDGGSNAEGNPDFNRMCSMGVVRGIGSPRSYTDSGRPVYERQYYIGMTECDCGDQTRFAGWGLVFDLIFRAKVPADDTCPVGRVTEGICPVPVYQRP